MKSELVALDNQISATKETMNREEASCKAGLQTACQEGSLSAAMLDHYQVMRMEVNARVQADSAVQDARDEVENAEIAAERKVEPSLLERFANSLLGFPTRHGDPRDLPLESAEMKAMQSAETKLRNAQTAQVELYKSYGCADTSPEGFLRLDSLPSVTSRHDPMSSHDNREFD